MIMISSVLNLVQGRIIIGIYFILVISLFNERRLLAAVNEIELSSLLSLVS